MGVGRLLLRAVGTSQLAGQVPASCRHASPLGLPASLCWCWGGQRMRGWVGTWPSPRARGLPGLLWLPGPFHWGLWETVAWLDVCGKPWLPPMAGGQRKGLPWTWPFSSQIPRGVGQLAASPPDPVLGLLLLAPQPGLPGLLPTKYGDLAGGRGCLLCPHPCSAAWPGLACGKGRPGWRGGQPLTPALALLSGACDPVVSAPRTAGLPSPSPRAGQPPPGKAGQASASCCSPGRKPRVLLLEGGFLLPLWLPGRASAPCMHCVHSPTAYPSICPATTHLP